MFKDYDKYLSKSLQVYLFVLVLVIILKIVGLDYFGIDINNPTIIKLSNFVSANILGDIINFITLFIEFYLYLLIVSNNKKVFIYALLGTLLNIGVQIVLIYYLKLNVYYSLFSLLLFMIVPMIIERKIFFKKQIITIVLLYSYQLISLFVRNVGIHNNYKNFLIDIVLNVDQMLLLLITFEIIKKRGGSIICIQEQVVGSYSQKKQNLKKLPKKLQKNYQSNLEDYKKKSKEEKLTFIIYFTLSLIWNTLSVFLILVAAKINGTLIECLFILTSFWLSKGKFGKPFHFESMLVCFIVSNASYYVLNKISTPIGISILVPILLGVGLSYLTSKFVKKKYKPLYKGMPEELFEETILQVEDKDSLKYKICYDSYILKETDVSLSYKYNYSVPGIRKIKDRINKKIKDL